MESCMKTVAVVTHFKQRQEILGIIAWKLRREDIFHKKRNFVYWHVYSHMKANGGVQNIKCKIEPGLEEPQMPCEGIQV